MIVYGVFTACADARQPTFFDLARIKSSAHLIMTVKGVDAQKPLEYVSRTFGRP